MPRFIIEVYADTNCPYSYIGKHYLDRAILEHSEKHPDAEFDILWRAYYLDPAAKPSAYKLSEYFRLKFGDRTPAVISNFEKIGAELGIDFKWDGQTGNTRDSHKLILLAEELDKRSRKLTLTPPPPQQHQQPQQEQERPALGGPDPSPSGTNKLDTTPAPRGVQRDDEEAGDRSGSLKNALLDQLFQGGFEEKRDISDRAFLVEAARKAGIGLSDQELRACMDSPRAGAVADGMAARARMLGITAVPSYLVQRKYWVGGAQPPEVFLQLFEKIESLQDGGSQPSSQETV